MKYWPESIGAEQKCCINQRVFVESLSSTLAEISGSKAISKLNSGESASNKVCYREEMKMAKY